MRCVTYADRTLLMGDAMADSLMRYARELADRGRSDSVTVPAVAADGTDLEATLLLTPHTALVVETTDFPGDAPVDHAFVRELTRRTERLVTPPRGHPVFEGATTDVDDDI